MLINTHLIDGAHCFFSSSACAYNTELQKTPTARALKESDAHPAMYDPD